MNKKIKNKSKNKSSCIFKSIIKKNSLFNLDLILVQRTIKEIITIKT